MKLNFLFFLLFLLIACNPDEIFRKSPIIHEIKIEPSDTVFPLDTVYVEVNASNPEKGILSYHWSVDPASAGSNFLDPLSNRSIRWIAPSVGQDYFFRVVVSNAYKSTEARESVKVVERVAPIVEILEPPANDYFVQYSPVNIKAYAFHNNGINRIQLFINDSIFSERSGSSTYLNEFVFIPDSSIWGEVEIKIQARANNVPTLGKDSILVNIEPILPGKSYQ
jgi:hypothetical protein